MNPGPVEDTTGNSSLGCDPAPEGAVLFDVRHVDRTHHAGSRSEVRALQDVSFRIASGTCTAIVGSSGSGKSTLLAILGCLDRPSRGEVLFAGEDLTQCSDVELARVRRQMGFIFQDFALIPSLPVWENITYPLIPRGMPRAARYQRAKALLDQLGLAEKMTKIPSELSGGEQQRVGVARALAGHPRILLADEPTSNLDAASATALMSVFQTLLVSGATVIFSSHDSQLLALADTVLELDAGHLKSVRSNGK